MMLCSRRYQGFQGMDRSMDRCKCQKEMFSRYICQLIRLHPNTHLGQRLVRVGLGAGVAKRRVGWLASAPLVLDPATVFSEG